MLRQLSVLERYDSEELLSMLRAGPSLEHSNVTPRAIFTVPAPLIYLAPQFRRR
jgi:hypothetical protein